MLTSFLSSKKIWPSLGLAGLLVGLLPVIALALPYGSGLYGTCAYSSCGLIISTNGNVSLSVTPTASGVYTTQSDSVSVTTNASTGYTLTLNDASTDNRLLNGSDFINASTGSQATPAARSMNSWGYRIDNLGGFGAGPTTAEQNALSSGYTFAGLPASNQTADTIKVTSGPASADITTVWYGVAVDSSLPSGSYATTVTYTAVTN